MNNTEAVKWVTILVHTIFICFGWVAWGWENWPYALMYFGVTTPIWLLYIEMRHYNAILRKWLNLK